MGLWAAWLATEASDSLSSHPYPSSVSHWRLVTARTHPRILHSCSTFHPATGFHCTDTTPVWLSCPKNTSLHLRGVLGMPLTLSLSPLYPSCDSLQLRTAEDVNRGLVGSFRPESYPWYLHPGTRAAPSISPSVIPTCREATCWERLRHCTLPSASTVFLPRLPSAPQTSVFYSFLGTTCA